MDRSLFNLRQLKAETKTSNNRIYELQYADEATILAHSAAGIQSSLYTLTSRAELVVNIKKTKVLSVITYDSPTPPFTVHRDNLSKVQEFTYRGRLLSDSCSLDSEVEHHIKAASSAYIPCCSTQKAKKGIHRHQTLPRS